MTRVAACGLTTLDLVQYVEHLPAADEKVQALDARIEFGGPAANAAFTAHALGLQVRLITCIGDSALGRILHEELTNAGIEVVDLAAHGSWRPPVSSVAVTAHQRAVISVNASAAPTKSLPEGSLDDCTALLVDGHHLRLCLAAATQARIAGIPVLLDGGSWKPGLEALIPMVDAAVLSADFEPPTAIEWHGRPVAISDGAEPIRYWHGAERGVIDVDPVVEADTLGAGDVLHGAWLTHVGRFGLSDWAQSLRFASRIATLSCRHPGAHEWASHI